MLNALSKLIAELEQNSSLYEPDQLRERIEALDRFDRFNLEMPPPARAIQAKLEAANYEIYEAIRADIKLGRGLLQWIPSSSPNPHEGYDYLDELLAGVFRFEDLGAITVQPTAEMVFYQPTPARHIFDLLNRTTPNSNDVLIDLGSGLGQVPLLTSICTSAHAVGIELEPVYINSARQTAEALNLKRVTFIQQDAQAADFTEGTVFYLYTPFTGMMLRAVLDSLRRQSANRDIRVCTFGPCTATVANEDWLEAIGPAEVDRISIFKVK